jgi:hypothetical protein
MSMVRYYLRGDARRLGELNDDTVFEDGDPARIGIDLLYIDKADEPLAWLASAAKRAERAYDSRLLERGTTGLDKALRASRARLDATPIDDLLTAIEGRPVGDFETRDIRIGAVMFGANRVGELSAALAAVTEESLRVQVDPPLMHEQDVGPSDEWLSHGDELLRSYVMPALGRLQAFYRAATEQGQAVMIVWT